MATWILNEFKREIYAKLQLADRQKELEENFRKSESSRLTASNYDRSIWAPAENELPTTHASVKSADERLQDFLTHPFPMTSIIDLTQPADRL